MSSEATNQLWTSDNIMTTGISIEVNRLLTDWGNKSKQCWNNFTWYAATPCWQDKYYNICTVKTTGYSQTLHDLMVCISNTFLGLNGFHKTSLILHEKVQYEQYLILFKSSSSYRSNKQICKQFEKLKLESEKKCIHSSNLMPNKAKLSAI